MSSIRHYRQEIAKAEETIRQKKILPPEISEMLSAYYKRMNEYYAKIEPELQVHKELIKKCEEAIDAIRKGRNGMEEKMMDEYTAWLDAYLSGVTFTKLKPYIRELLAGGKWVRITAPSGSAGVNDKTGETFIITKAKHWIAQVTSTGYYAGNRYCELYGKITKKEKQLIYRFVTEITEGKRGYDNSFYLADIFANEYKEEERKKLKEHW